MARALSRLGGELLIERCVELHKVFWQRHTERLELAELLTQHDFQLAPIMRLTGEPCQQCGDLCFDLIECHLRSAPFFSYVQVRPKSPRSIITVEKFSGASAPAP
jgi:hypothetical protein